MGGSLCTLRGDLMELLPLYTFNCHAWFNDKTNPRPALFPYRGLPDCLCIELGYCMNGKWGLGVVSRTLTEQRGLQHAIWFINK